MEEVLKGSVVCGHPIENEFIEKMVEATDGMVAYRTSMKIDYDEKRSMEIEAIYGIPLRLSRYAGADLPTVSMLYQQLQFLNQKNCSIR
jgi:2-dehydropantoate 2-reductase